MYLLIRQAKYKEKPPSECYEAAKSNEATAYHQVELSEKAIKSCLASGYPIAMGITLYKAFESDAVAANGRVPMPQPGEEPEGGHAVCMVGYDDNQREFIMRNSSGETRAISTYHTNISWVALLSPVAPLVQVTPVGTCG
ncbi:hypothetical protein CEUSTIGMA_g11617.t1 [Chlamydomonas eustigma]|uniref:Peptidase C39-like domain-containing protein n=1 Tax=Chlamydomonas eustigma TaxID=1157962 RepID=A0A250XM84_9CHLO|nr:hypothetical protein CEUSTIGMA_g11617.t1 [Chlamydomonas eustigma]|eukprot:GAX84194.1 hypothetical protein CEUSTIGMA_g11617.t1 [Chlamydomonas eustigma]